MPEDRKDDEREDDEFEPLDKFFAPIEDVDWPEDQARRKGDEAGTPPPPPVPAGAPEDDLVLPDIPDDPLAGVEAEVEASWTPDAVEPAGDEAGAPPMVPSEPFPSEPTVEIS